MRFPALFLGGWKILTHILLLSPSSASDLALLLLPRPSSLQGCSVLTPRHLRLDAVLPSVNLPTVPCFLFSGYPLSPGARPAGDALPLVTVRAALKNHLKIN